LNFAFEAAVKSALASAGVAEGEVGTRTVVDGIGIVGRERYGGVVGIEGLIGTTEQQQGITMSIQSFGGEGCFLLVIGRQAIAQGFEYKFAGGGGGFDFRRCRGGVFEVFFHLFQQRFDWRGGEITSAVDLCVQFQRGDALPGFACDRQFGDVFKRELHWNRHWWR
jgi:hypothetical protein